MKRLHIHLSVDNVEQSIPFYASLFGQQPDKLKSDYARWKLDDPRVNFAISSRSRDEGLDHLGVQYDSEQELQQARERMLTAQHNVGDSESSTCCYAESIKAWSLDPAGIPWENFVSMGDAEIYGHTQATEQACCGSTEQASASRCC